MSNRNIIDVLEDVISLSKDEELIRKLKYIIKKVPYTAPEIMGTRWHEGNIAVHEYCLNEQGSPEYKWQVDILSKWSTKTVDEICEYHRLEYQELVS